MMRTLPALPVLSIILALWACGGDDGASGETDARTGSETDARTGDPDGGTVETDAGPRTTRVRVTVLTDRNDGQPDLTATVIFADSSNELVQDGLVGPGGVAEADLPNGGIVHVLRVVEDGESHRTVSLVSVLDVAPGDELILGEVARRPRGEPVSIEGSFTPVAGADDYGFAHPCGSGIDSSSGAAVLLSFAGCLPDVFEGLATARSLRDPTFLPKYAWFTAEGPGFVVPELQDMPRFTARIANAPESPFMLLDRSTILRPYFAVATSPITSQDLIPPGASTVDLYYPPSPSAIGLLKARFGEMFGPQQVLSARIPGDAATADLDFGAVPLPVITTSATLAGRVMTWNQTGTGEPDIRYVRASTTHTAGLWDYTVYWITLDGSAESSAVLPGLPAKFAEIDPTRQLTSQPDGVAQVMFVDYSNVDGYDAARRYPLGTFVELDDFSCVSCGLFGDALYTKRVSASGTLF